jgi:hypothetical protein
MTYYIHLHHAHHAPSSQAFPAPLPRRGLPKRPAPRPSFLIRTQTYMYMYIRSIPNANAVPASPCALRF